MLKQTGRISRRWVGYLPGFAPCTCKSVDKSRRGVGGVGRRDSTVWIEEDGLGELKLGGWVVSLIELSALRAHGKKSPSVHEYE